MDTESLLLVVLADGVVLWLEVVLKVDVKLDTEMDLVLILDTELLLVLIDEPLLVSVLDDVGDVDANREVDDNEGQVLAELMELELLLLLLLLHEQDVL
eukprot:4382184-Amphidinium_carterae.1